MGGSSRRRGKNRSSEQSSHDLSHGETAARTRPLSFDEIMSRRKKKEELSESGKGLEDLGDHVARKDDESGRGDVGSKDAPLGMERDLKEEHVKESSRKTRERTYGKDEDLSRKKGREIGELDVKLRPEMSKDLRTEGKSEIDRGRRKNGNDFHGEDAKKHLGVSVGKYGRPEGSRIKSVIEVTTKDKHDGTVYGRRKGDSRASNKSENEAGKRHSRDLSRKSERVDGAKMLEMEDKRKYQNGVDEKNKDKSNFKRQDLKKGHDSEMPEMKDRKESRNPHYEEERMKRQRSRSREREERRRRSTSPSLRAHKRASYHGRERHPEIPPYSHKGRPERRHSDIDRSQLINNGSSSHQRRHDGSSGLGGYSPRKRRSEAAVKTPSPARLSPEKKSAKWDLAPEGTDNTVSTSITSNSQLVNQAALSNINELVGAVPPSLSTVKHVSVFSPGVWSTSKFVTKDSIQLTQATRPMRRLYVENVPPSVSESTMIEFLNNLLVSSGANHIEGTQPCLSCIIHKEKGQALVEFLTPEDASIALSFDGCSFLGSSIKIRRPKDFVEVTGEKEKSVSGVDSTSAKSAAGVDSVSKKSVALVDPISDIVMDSPNKIFVGGISSALSSKMLMEIAGAFGPLKAYQFVSSKDHSEPFAFLEYADKSVSLKACAGLSGMKLGGKVITAVQAVPDLSSMESSESPFCGIPEHAIPLLEEPALVLRLKNVFDAETLSSLSETEIEEILEDVRLECVSFGAVKSVNVVKGDPNHPSPSEACDVNDDMVTNGIDQNFGNDEVNAKTEALKEAALDEVVEMNIVDEKTAGDLMEDESHQPQSLDNSSVRDSSIPDDKSTGDCMDDDSHQPETVDRNSMESNSNVGEKSEGDTMVDEPCQPEFGEQSGTDEGKTNDKPDVDLLERGSCLQGDLGSDTVIEDFSRKTTSNSQPLPQLASKDESNLIVQEAKDSIQVDTGAETGLAAIGCSNVDEINEEAKQPPAANKPGTEADAVEKRNREEDDQNLGDIFEQGCVFVEFRRIESSCMAAHCLHRRTFDDRVVTVRYVPLDIYCARFPR